MSKEEAIIHYKTAVVVFERWLAEGIISKAELAKIDTVVAQKYGLSSSSIFR